MLHTNMLRVLSNLDSNFDWRSSLPGRLHQGEGKESLLRPDRAGGMGGWEPPWRWSVQHGSPLSAYESFSGKSEVGNSIWQYRNRLG